MSEFHAHSGWFFERLLDGGVRMSLRDPERPADDGHIIDVTFDDGTWGSIVASVSEGGETKGRWFSAMDFHHGRSGDREGYA